MRLIHPAPGATTTTFLRKVIPGTLVFVLTAALYEVTNHFPVRAPTALPLTPIDSGTPVVPWTIWVYASYPFIFVLTFLLQRDADRLDRWMKATVALNALSNLVFFLFPTTLERTFSLPEETPGWTRAAFERVHAIDAPANCLPSLHVSTAYLSSFVWLEGARRSRGAARWTAFALAFLWANAIALSTLTTKQHYLVDVVSGLGLALVFHRTFLVAQERHHG